MGRLGEEVSEKIKSAVRAKLMELGIHMDNELPDYVMVLVANKKSQKQMEQDLQLFLGPSTVIFTTWLHNVLKRLEQVTVSSKGVKKRSEEKKTKSKRRLSNEDEEDEKKAVKKTKHVKVESSPENDMTIETVNDVEAKKETQSASDDENDYLNLRADTDPEELGESIDNFQEGEPLQTLVVNPDVESSRDNSANKREEARLPQPKECSEEQVTKKNKPPERPKERVKITWDCDTKSNDDKSEKLNESEDSNSRSSSKIQEKQRVGRRRSSDQDPIMPSVAVLKSAVRDLKDNQNSAGKSSRSMRDQEKPLLPVEKIKKYLKDDQDKKPVVYDARDIIRRKSSVKKRSPECNAEKPVKEDSEAVEKKKQLPSISKLVIHDRGGPDRPPDVTVPSLVKVTPRPARRTGVQANHKLILRAVADAEKSVATAKNTCKLKSPERNVKTKRKDLLGYIPPAKISVTLPNDRVPSTKDADFEMSEITEKSVEKNIKDSGIEPDLSNDVEEELDKKREASYIWRESVSGSQDELNVSSPPRGTSSDFEPEFLITLGNDMASDLYGMEGELDWGEDVQPESSDKVVYEERRVLADSTVTSETSNQRVVYSKTPFNRSRLGPPPAVAAVRPIQKISERIAEIDGITVDVDTTTANKVVQLKLMKRCKFWPNCAAADKCMYHHPETLCRSFPNCTYGEQCIYVHPPCKFGEKCLNVNCPFLHVIAAPKKGRQPLPLSIPRSEQCIYYPNCTNKLCRFHHPKKLCKYGLKCSNWGCEFDHSKALLPSKDQLTWTPSKR